LLGTAHSIPVALAEACDYESQLHQTAALVASGAGYPDHRLVWQSRSGPPSVPWLEPDINDHLRTMAGSVDAVVVAPIGFVSDHMEVVWDLDVEAAATADEVGIHMERAATPGTGPDPRFTAMLADLVEERLDPTRPRLGLGPAGPRPDMCPQDCCPPPRSG
jgi:ferrochelatase